ncbi:MAG: GNAT family N-acetyltransferase [Pseudomonadota bacterium]
MRRYTPDDAGACAAVFHSAVHGGTGRFYDAAQQQAWSPAQPTAQQWRDRLEGQTVYVAVDTDGVCGFMSLTDAGYLDFAYVLPRVMGAGVADLLYAAILNVAHVSGLNHLTVAASHVARRFFLRHGWQEDAEQKILRNGVDLTNFRMSVSF